MSSFLKLVVGQDLRNGCKCSKLESYSESQISFSNTLKNVWKGEILLSMLQRITHSPNNVYLDEDPIPPTLGALHHVKGMCSSEICLYCN